MIDKDINHLSPVFRARFDAWRSEVQRVLPTARVFETKRSLVRQKLLYKQWRTRTLRSKHLTGNAVDIVFLNSRWQPMRKGNYALLRQLAAKHGIGWVKFESCHFELLK